MGRHHWGRCHLWRRSPVAFVIHWGLGHSWSCCGDLLGVLRFGVLWMTATGLRLTRCYRPILDALILTAALDVGLRCRRRLSLLSDTRAGGECEQESKRNAEA